MQRRSLLAIFIVGVLAGVIGWGIGVAWSKPNATAITQFTTSTPPSAENATPAPPVPAPGSQNLPTLAPVLKQALQGVVNISASGITNVESNPLFSDPFFRHFFSPFGSPFNDNNDNDNQPPIEQEHTQSIGSGVIVDAKNGYVLTNQHLVNKATEIYVVLQDKRKIRAKVIGADKDMDIALLQIKEDHLTALPMGDSDNIQVGDFVMAIGNPFGLGNTATFGIISALGRTGLGIEGYEDFIQTDASINPGNSGGALVNLKGQLIGINTAIVSGGGGNVGIGFAIPINVAKQVMDELIAHGGKVNRGQLGVQVQDVTPGIKQAMDLPVDAGAVVTQVMRNSAAAKAGIESGDVITGLDGKKITGASSLRLMVGLKQIGDKVTIDLIRKGEHKTLTATIGAPVATETGRAEGVDLLKGVEFSPIPQDNPLYGRIQGVMVASIDANSEAAFSGLQKGDIVVAVNQQKVSNVEELIKAAKAGKDHLLLLNVRRGDESLFIVIE